MAQAATRTGASEHLGSLPWLSGELIEGFYASVSQLAATFVNYLKALWMGNT